MIDVVDKCLWVYQLYQILDNLDNIFFRQYADIHIRRKIQFSIDTVTSNFTQIITFLWKEQIIDDFTCTGIICGVGVTQLTVNV